MNRLPFLILMAFSVTALFFAACEDEFRISDQRDDAGYYPLEVGQYISYQLDSIVFDDFQKEKFESFYQVRELVESTFEDAAGNMAYRIERAFKTDESANWGDAGYQIWFAYKDGRTAERIEENQRYIKLSFPLSINKEWQGNQYINFDLLSNQAIDSTEESPIEYLRDWDYEITAIDEPLSINGFDFDSTLTVSQHEYSIQTDTIGAKEIYAKNVGLIFKELFVVSTQCSYSFDCEPNDVVCRAQCFASPWEAKGESGFILRQTIIGFGKL